MPESGGRLTIDGHEVRITYVDCTLFAGRLDIDFGSLESSDGGGEIYQIPVGDEIEYVALHDCVISIDDCRNMVIEGPSSKLWFAWNRETYLITSLHVDCIKYEPEIHQLSLNIKLTGEHHERGTPISVKAELVAECNPIDATFLRRRMCVLPESIPIRFASHYLRMVGLPEMPVGISRDQVIALIGPPNNEGGGHHPKFGQIPAWSTHLLSDWVVCFEFDAEQVTNVMFCPATDNLGIQLASGRSEA